MMRPTARPSRFGFTLVELLIVIVILALLIALLLPAIQGAVRSARNATVSSEVNQLVQALADFKSKYGDYPPSRILLSENGYYNTADTTFVTPTSDAAGATAMGDDLTYGQLAQRSISYLRKFFPRVTLSTSARVWPAVPATPYPAGTTWYDFNGDGVYQDDTTGRGYLLQGHECLVFFLGGIPVLTASGTGLPNFGMTGFGKLPTNPFTNSLLTSPMYNNNRYPPLFEFKGERLVNLDGNNLPGYWDPLGAVPSALTPLPLSTGTPLNFYAYFSSYGSNGYDPNDVNFTGYVNTSFATTTTPMISYVSEFDSSGSGTPIAREYLVTFPVQGSALNGNNTALSLSPSPNPYTTSLPVGTTSTTFQNPNSFQIISAGADGLYGVGGQFDSSTASATTPLPTDSAFINTTDKSIRLREQDNITNFKNGRLQ